MYSETILGFSLWVKEKEKLTAISSPIYTFSPLFCLGKKRYSRPSHLLFIVSTLYISLLQKCGVPTPDSHDVHLCRAHRQFRRATRVVRRACRRQWIDIGCRASARRMEFVHDFRFPRCWYIVLTVAPAGRLFRVIRAPAIRRDDHNRRGKYRRHVRNDRRSGALRGLDHCYLSVTGPVGRVRHMSPIHCFDIFRPFFLLPITWLLRIVLPFFFFFCTSFFCQTLRFFFSLQ